MSAPCDNDDDGGNRLSGAFIVVLLLHVIAVIGVFAFARIKESRRALIPVETSQTPKSKADIGQTTPQKSAPVVPAPVPAQATPPIATHESPKTPPPGQRTTHIVQNGETLTKIALAFKADVRELVAVNKLKNQDDIRAGQTLVIPQIAPGPKLSGTGDTKSKGSGASGAKTTAASTDKKAARPYIVREHDNLVKIAREHDCTYDELVRLNNLKDPKKIQPGQVLKLPPKKG